LDNSGYLFEKHKHWFVRECTIKEDHHMEISAFKYSILIDQQRQFLILKRTDYDTEKAFPEWDGVLMSPLNGFIFYNQIYFFSGYSVYIVEDNREFPKAGFEYLLAYQVHSLKNFFRCQRSQMDYSEQLGQYSDKFYEDCKAYFILRNL